MGSVGHVFNVPMPRDFEHVENVLHENFTVSERAFAAARTAESHGSSPERGGSAFGHGGDFTGQI